MPPSYSSQEIIRPPRLLQGDTIGVVSPAGPLNAIRQERLDRGLAYLRARGYTVLEGKSLRAQTGYLAGSDDERLHDINDMLNNPDVRAIFCSRGGYGISRLLDKIDYDAARRDPKIIMGYSDVTALSLALYKNTGLITFAGPMAAIELHDIDAFTEHSVWQMLSGESSILHADIENNPWRIISSGTAEGPLLGGCLSVLSPLIGTPFCPDFVGSILLLEDVGEDLYKIDRLFSHLKNAGILDTVNGIVLGQFVDITPDSNDNPVEFDDIISYYCAPLSIPVISNFPYGHVPKKYTLPIGCPVRLDADAGTLQLLHAGVT